MIWQALKTYSWPHRRQLGFAALLCVAETAATVALPWIAGLASYRVITGEAVDLPWLVAVLVGLMAFQAVLRFVSRWIGGRVAGDVLADLRRRVFAHVQSLPLQFHTAHRRGEILSIISQDVAHVGSFISGSVIHTGPALLTALGAGILMFHLDSTLAVGVCVGVCVMVLALKLLGRRLREISHRSRAAEARALALSDEMLAHVQVIKSFAAEDISRSRFDEVVMQCRRHNASLSCFNAAVSPASEFIAMAGIAALIAFAGVRFGGAEASAAATVSFILYAMLLTRPVSRLASSYGQVQMAISSLARLQNLLEKSGEPASGVQLPMPVRGAISFRGVHFAYPGRCQIINGFSLDIAAGETVALTGLNGVGKSTLAHLLLRLYEPDQGRILLDGHDIAHIELASLRRVIGLVPQQITLFNSSVRDNIAFGRPLASDAEIEAAARLAEAHGFISSLPAGYHTVIGDEGVRLSGGQRQRIALARALLPDPSILILDEATATLDPEGEIHVVDGLRSLKGSRTIFIITHRAASLALADRVVEIDRGVAIDVRRLAA